jgi:hypothetical protein
MSKLWPCQAEKWRKTKEILAMSLVEPKSERQDDTLVAQLA